MEHFTNIETEFSETINSKVFRNEDASVELRHLDEMIEKEDRLVTKVTLAYIQYYLIWTTIDVIMK